VLVDNDVRRDCEADVEPMRTGMTALSDWLPFSFVDGNADRTIPLRLDCGK
jgi:hypothetical protein